MNLSEIIISPGKAEPDLVHAIDFLASLFQKSKRLIKISSTIDIFALEDRFYTLVSNGRPVAWVELGDMVTIVNNSYDTIKIIYALPEVRKTYAIGAFLIALKRQLKRPLILGSDSYGGVLFKDGVQLVKRLHKGTLVDVKLLDLKTGISSNFDADNLSSSKGQTLVFEMIDFPIVHSVADDKISLFVFEGCETWTETS